jgi:hypothetical protein
MHFIAERLSFSDGNISSVFSRVFNNPSETGFTTAAKRAFFDFAISDNACISSITPKKFGD